MDFRPPKGSIGNWPFGNAAPTPPPRRPHFGGEEDLFPSLAQPQFDPVTRRPPSFSDDEISAIPRNRHQSNIIAKRCVHCHQPCPGCVEHYSTFGSGSGEGSPIGHWPVPEHFCGNCSRPCHDCCVCKRFEINSTIRPVPINTGTLPTLEQSHSSGYASTVINSDTIHPIATTTNSNVIQSDDVKIAQREGQISFSCNKPGYNLQNLLVDVESDSLVIQGEQMIKTSGGQTVQQIFRHLVPLPPGGIVKDSILKEMDEKGNLLIHAQLLQPIQSEHTGSEISHLYS